MYLGEGLPHRILGGQAVEYRCLETISLFVQIVSAAQSMCPFELCKPVRGTFAPLCQYQLAPFKKYLSPQFSCVLNACIVKITERGRRQNLR